METRICQNCKNDFTIEPEDFSFYEKIKVPPPTFCPECRLVRRLLWRNERNLYKRTCKTKDGEAELLTNYSPEAPFPVYEQEYWWSDAWDAMAYGQEYDFNRPFFEQLKKLLSRVPEPHETNLQNTDSKYCNFTYQLKNCYFVFASDMNEDSAYLHQSMKCLNSYDLEGCEAMNSCIMGYKSKGCYESSYTFFSENCLNSHLMWDCHNCKDCFGCVNLRNVSHAIFNVQYSKEEYEQEIKKYLDGSHQTLKANLERFFEMRLDRPRKYADIIQSEKVTGDHIRNAKNCHYCFDIANKLQDCKFTSYAFSNTNQCYDLFAGGVNMELGYEIMSAGENAQNLFMSAMVWSCTDAYYSVFCGSCANIFGCVGLRNKEHCIFNKQYTKAEYEELVPRIREHMEAMLYVDSLGRTFGYGEFFPYDLSPFAYNETPAGDYYPLTKSEVEAKGLRWKEKEKNNYPVTLPVAGIPDNIADIDDSLTSEVIECEDHDREYSPGAFRVIPAELSLYKKLNIPVPRKSAQARFHERLAFKNPFKLWRRQCMCDKENHGHAGICDNEFETSYAPERPEKIYCESCYQKEVI